MARPIDKTKKVKLTDSDWDLLLPGKVVTLGNTILDVKPLGLEDLGSIIRRVSTIRDDLSKSGLTLENYSKGEGLMKLTTILVEKIPDVLSDATGVAVEDIRKLPLTMTMSLLSAVIEVNLQSQEGLLKNFETLAENVTTLVGSISGKSLSSSLKTDTVGEMLKNTPSEK